MPRSITALSLTLSIAIAAWGAAPTPVAEAAASGDKAAVRNLIQQKADVNAPQADGATALHWAVYHSDKDLVDMLLRAGADPKIANREGSTPLWLASISGDAAILESLLKAGADPNEKLPLGRTPLMAAARTGKVDAIKVLLDHGAQVNAKETLRGTTPLMWAADEGHAPAIKFLLEHGADIAARSDMAERGRGPALGKANDPRKQVAAQGAALAAGQALDLSQLSGLRGDNNGIGGGRAGAGRAGAAGAQAAGGGRGRGGRGGAGAAGGNDQGADQQDDAFVAAFGARGRPAVKDGGALTPLIYAVRSNDVESAKVLLDAGADVNQTSGYGWSPLLVATQNRYYKLAAYLISRGADVNLANKGGWTPLYLATDNRNIESGDYPVRRPDMDHLDFIKLLLDKGANVNARMKDSTETRTVFTNQWLDENGATAFLRASQSGDIELMKLLLAHGADPKIDTALHVTALQVAAGIGWVEGITYEWSPQATFEACKMLIDLGLDVNAQADTGRTALHGAGHKGRTDVIQLLVDHGAKLDVRDYGNTDNRGGKLAIHTWQPVDYADGLVRVGVQSAIAHPEAGLLLRELMTERGLPAPPVGRTLESICITDACGD
ncbi:MAG: ankyrin repeat domain-containing protein [Bryobacterales bacterium]|nr:ankyrin repeat domain-containing protein [Bryobacterales bacterium]MBV9398737.1 ankyrin repeat domain-containing protein [Bryobacterales bacterium]